MNEQQQLLAAGVVFVVGLLHLICYWLGWTEIFTWVDWSDRIDGIPDEQMSHESALTLAKWMGITLITVACLVFLKHILF